MVHRIPITKARINLGQLVRRAHVHKEYFLLENRVHDLDGDSLFSFEDVNGDGCFDFYSDSYAGAEFDFFLPATRVPTGATCDAGRHQTGSGVLIYHVDEAKITATAGDNLVEADTERKGIDLIIALDRQPHREVATSHALAGRGQLLQVACEPEADHGDQQRRDGKRDAAGGHRLAYQLGARGLQESGRKTEAQLAQRLAAGLDTDRGVEASAERAGIVVQPFAEQRQRRGRIPAGARYDPVLRLPLPPSADETDETAAPV